MVTADIGPTTSKEGGTAGEESKSDADKLNQLLKQKMAQETVIGSPDWFAKTGSGAKPSKPTSASANKGGGKATTPGPSSAETAKKAGLLGRAAAVAAVAAQGAAAVAPWTKERGLLRGSVALEVGKASPSKPAKAGNFFVAARGPKPPPGPPPAWLTKKAAFNSAVQAAAARANAAAEAVEEDEDYDPETLPMKSGAAVGLRAPSAPAKAAKPTVRPVNTPKAPSGMVRVMAPKAKATAPAVGSSSDSRLFTPVDYAAIARKNGAAAPGPSSSDWAWSSW